nr:MAG TPA: transposase-like protein [Caudoviricetes sp.]
MPTHLHVLCSIPPLFDYTIIARGTLEFWWI